ncbi:MFS transporter [Micromonosporaceae bacterium Da 78-11]
MVGARSDRTGRRLGLFRACAVAGFVSWAAIAFSTQLRMPFVLSAVVGAFGGAATSQLFAAVHDETKAHPNPGNDGVVAIVRMALTAGWVVGPVAGSFLAAHTSIRTVLLATTIATAAQIVPLRALRTRPSNQPGPTRQPASGGPGLREMLPLLTFTALYVLVYAGESIKYAYLPIFAALGVIVAQNLLPSAVATASAIFLSSTAVSSALGGAAGGLGAAVVGLPHVFLIPAGLALVAVVGLTAMTRSAERIHRRDGIGQQDNAT